MICFWDSSEEEVKTVDTTGTVNNNVVIQDAVTVHSSPIIIILAIILFIKICELIYIIFKSYNRAQKKKYTKRPTIALN